MSDELPKSKMILYQTEDGRTRIQCRFENETIWLSLNQMAELFLTTKQNVSLHIQNIFEEGELQRVATVKESLTVQPGGKLPTPATIRKFQIVQLEGARSVEREVDFYNLDVIISVGYRVKSHRGTQFRIWATERLREYIVKGFTMDDERLKNPPGKGQKDYFDEQLERIRDIRSSERRFYQKVLDIYALSVDYSPDTEMSRNFFATVQNKMHWATHGQTAAEVIHARVDASKPLMGLKTTRPGGIVRRDDVSIAKNYLGKEELQTLNRIVNAYLEFAELQARSRRVMTMRDWIAKLDEFLKLSDFELLDHAGKISAEAAKAKAEAEYDKFRAMEDAKPLLVDKHFQEAIEQAKKLADKKPRKKKP
jgi:hypothetical protein